ncbi:MAG: DUF11 domain-containing protein [Ruminococcus sp.]|nr:DUF11 domain-containing protein [Ruminococcus sp.]
MAAFYNQASLSYNGTVTSSNITTGEILEVLSATKTAVSDSYTAGDEIVFVVNMVNSGSASLNNITLTDDLGAYSFGETSSQAIPLTYIEGSLQYFVNGIPQPAPAVTSLSPLTVTGLNVPAGGNAAVVYATRVNEFAPLGDGASITNTADITGTGITGVSAQANIASEEGAVLTISKSLSPVAVEENGAVTYTFTIQNSGSAPATEADEVIFTDVFDPVLTNLRASFNGTEWTAANYTYDQVSGSFTSLPGQITVPAASFSQDPDTGIWSVQPGISTLTITGNIS